MDKLSATQPVNKYYKALGDIGNKPVSASWLLSFWVILTLLTVYGKDEECS